MENKNYIIIPIKDIEDRLETHKKEKRRLVKNGNKEYTQYEDMGIDIYSELLKLGKQISLDEKDIETKAAKFAVDNIGYYKKIKYDGMSLHTGYKQALKDLL